MERINTLKRLSNLFYPDYQLDFTDDRTLLLNFFKNINNFSPTFIDIMKDYMKFISNNEIYDHLLNSMIESLNKSPEKINPNLINLFNWVYVDSYGKISENNFESILQIVNKLEIMLLGFLEKVKLESMEHMCCYEIVDLLIQIILIADSRIIFHGIFINSLFNIFNQFSVCKNLSKVKIYNQFRMLKLLKISSMIMKFHSLESYGKLIEKLVFYSSAIGFTGELCTNSPLLEYMFIDLDFSSKSTASISRKRISLLMKLLLIVLDWIGNNIDDSHYLTSCSDILNVLNTKIRYLNTEFSISKNWILLFLKDDSKLIKFLSYVKLIEEKGLLASSLHSTELLDELFLDIDYDCDLLWQWFCEYEDLEIIFIHYFQHWNVVPSRSVDCCLNHRIREMFIQIHNKLRDKDKDKDNNQDKEDFEMILGNFLQMK